MGTNVFDPTVAANSNWPHETGGSTKITVRPITEPMTPLTHTFIYEQPTYVYVVQPEDTLGGVARKLFGSNTRHHRNHLLRNGFAVGQTITVHGYDAALEQEKGAD